MLSNSGWQRLARLLADDVIGVPIGPVLVVPAGPLFVLAVRGSCTSERGRELSDEVNVLSSASKRPGNRAVTSWNTQPLPLIRALTNGSFRAGGHVGVLAFGSEG